MAYTIRKSDGNVLMTVSDRTVNDDTPLEIPGRGVSNYGRILGENFIRLMENFANEVEPTASLAGQLWYDRASDQLKLFDGTSYRPISGAGDLMSVNNLSDVADIATARENLGLGTAAIRDTGTDADEISLNSDLGEAAFHDVGTGPDHIPTNAMIGSDNVYSFLKASNNLADVNSISTARNNLNLGTAATRDVGTDPGKIPVWEHFGTAAFLNTGTAPGNVVINSNLGTVVTYDVGTDSDEIPTNAQIATNYLRVGNNLSDVSSKSTARDNLNLGTVALYDVGTAANEVPTNATINARGYLESPNNLSDVDDAALARTNLGLGTVATYDVGTGSGEVPTNENVIKFPSGTRMIFAQATAPAGWTQDQIINDRVLRVVSNNTGGQQGGQWSITGIEADYHALTVDQMPAHWHYEFLAGDIPQYSSNRLHHPENSDFPVMSTSGTGNVNTEYAMSVNEPTDPTEEADAGKTSTVGGNEGHTHGITSDGSWRPSYINVIIAIKD